MTFVDLIVIALVVFGALAGYRQGLVAAAGSLIGAVGCALAALSLTPEIVRGLPDPVARTAATMAIVLVAVLIGEFVGGWIGSIVSDSITWAPVKKVDKTLGMVGQGLAVLALAWMVALPLASAPMPWLASSIRNSSILGAVDDAAPHGTAAFTDALRDLLNATGFPEIAGPLDPTPIVEVPQPDVTAATAALGSTAQQSVLRVRAVSTSCSKVFSGTGFAIGPDHVLTNAHVVGGAAQFSIEVGGRSIPAAVVDYNPDLDLAVLFAAGHGAPPLRLDQTPLPSQENALVVGYPQGGPYSLSPARVRSVTTLTGPNLYDDKIIEREVYLLRAFVRPGNSGGPVLDGDGEVVGIIFGVAIDDPETAFALTAAAAAGTIAAGLTDTSAADTGVCVLG